MSNFHGGYGAPRLEAMMKVFNSLQPSDYSIDKKFRSSSDNFRDGYHRFAMQTPSAKVKFYGVEDVTETLKRFGRLSTAMDSRNVEKLDPTDWENAPDPDRNRIGIPAGHVYLLQLAGHDLVHTSTSQPALHDGREATRNLRRIGLELETIFGGGPGACPYVYEAVEHLGLTKPRTKLKLGRFVSNDRKYFLEGPDSDQGELERFNQGETRPGEINLQDVLIADPRNDDNLILAQLTALFHKLHNVIVSLLTDREFIWVKQNQSGEKIKSDEILFAFSQGILAYVFRRIIQEEVLKGLIDERVYDLYRAAYEKSGTEQFFDQPRESHSRPIEFSFAASRLAHFMLRPDYSLNADTLELSNIIKFSSRRRWHHVPHEIQYKINWDLFFPSERVPDKCVNWAVKFRLSERRALKNRDLFKLPGEASNLRGSLFLHDMIRGTASLLPNASSISNTILLHIKENENDVDLMKGLRDIVPNREAIEEVLTAGLKPLASPDIDNPICERDILHFASDCPLYLYLILEAQEVGEECRLGPIGSILFAEVFFRSLSRREEDVGPERAEWEATIASATEALFDDIGYSDVPVTMNGLLDALQA